MVIRPELRQTRIGEFTIQSEHTGNGPPVVLLHGLSGSCRWWRFTTPALARRYAVHMPERLVLVNSSGLPRYWSLRDAGRFVARALPPRNWGAPTFVPTIAADALRAGPRALLLATRHLLSDDVTDLLPAITCPTLLIWGELDPIVPREQGRAMAGRIPGARFVVLRDAAHNPMADRPIEFNRVLLEFLDG